MTSRKLLRACPFSGDKLRLHSNGAGNSHLTDNSIMLLTDEKHGRVVTSHQNKIGARRTAPHNSIRLSRPAVFIVQRGQMFNRLLRQFLRITQFPVKMPDLTSGRAKGSQSAVWHCRNYWPIGGYPYPYAAGGGIGGIPCGPHLVIFCGQGGMHGGAHGIGSQHGNGWQFPFNERQFPRNLKGAVRTDRSPDRGLNPPRQLDPQFWGGHPGDMHGGGQGGGHAGIPHICPGQAETPGPHGG